MTLTKFVEQIVLTNGPPYVLLFALPVRLGGMGILNPMTCSSQCSNSSKGLTYLLVALIISQEEKLPSVDATLSETSLC